MGDYAALLCDACSRSAYEPDYIHLRPCPESERDSTSDTQRDIEHRAVLDVFPTPFVISPLDWREPPDLQLSGMGVSGKGEG